MKNCQEIYVVSEMLPVGRVTTCIFLFEQYIVEDYFDSDLPLNTLIAHWNGVCLLILSVNMH